MNKSIKKNLKLKIFNETNLIAIGQLYRWAGFKTWKEMAGKRKKYQQEEIDGNVGVFIHLFSEGILKSLSLY